MKGVTGSLSINDLVVISRIDDDSGVGISSMERAIGNLQVEGNGERCSCSNGIIACYKDLVVSILSAEKVAGGESGSREESTDFLAKLIRN